MLGHLAHIDPALQQQVEDALGLKNKAEVIRPAVPPRDLKPSDALSLIKKAKPTLQGRKVGVLVTNGFDAALLASLRKTVKSEKAALAVIAPKIGGASDNAGKLTPADMSLSGGPSIFFDVVAILTSQPQAEQLAAEAAAVDWIRDAFGHLKIIGCTSGAQPLLERAGIEPDEGVIELEDSRSVSHFIQRAKKGRLWEREPRLRSPG
jgi:catalase